MLALANGPSAAASAVGAPPPIAAAVPSVQPGAPADVQEPAAADKDTVHVQMDKIENDAEYAAHVFMVWYDKQRNPVAVQDGPGIGCPMCGGAVRSQPCFTMAAFGVVWERCAAAGCDWSGKLMIPPDQYTAYCTWCEETRRTPAPVLISVMEEGGEQASEGVSVTEEGVSGMEEDVSVCRGAM